MTWCSKGVDRFFQRSVKHHLFPQTSSQSPFPCCWNIVNHLLRSKIFNSTGVFKDLQFLLCQKDFLFRFFWFFLFFFGFFLTDNIWLRKDPLLITGQVSLLNITPDSWKITFRMCECNECVHQVRSIKGCSAPCHRCCIVLIAAGRWQWLIKYVSSLLLFTGSELGSVSLFSPVSEC